MYKDFEDYGWDVGSFCHKIYAGKERETNSQVIITTWQSIYKLPRKYFNRFGCVIGDEAHQFKSKSLISIMSKLIMPNIVLVLQELLMEHKHISGY